MLAREGVERRQEQATGARLGGDEAERSHRQTVVRREVVQQAALAAVGKNFGVDVQKDLRRQQLNLKTHLVVNGVGAGEAAAVLAAQFVVQQPAALGKFLFGGGGHLGQIDVGVLPGNDVAGARDAHGQLVILALNLAHGEDVKQLRVQGT